MPPLLLFDTFVDDAIVSIVDFLFCFFITFEKLFLRLCTHNMVAEYNPVRHGFSLNFRCKGTASRWIVHMFQGRKIDIVLLLVGRL